MIDKISIFIFINDNYFRYLGDDGGDQLQGEGAGASPEEILERQLLKKLLKKAKIRKSQAIVNAEGENKSLTEIPVKSENGTSRKRTIDSASTKTQKHAANIHVESVPNKKKMKKEMSRKEPVVNKVKGAAETEDKQEEIQGDPKLSNVAGTPLSKRAKRRAKEKNKKTALVGTELGVDFGGFTVIGDVNQFKQQTVS